MVLTRHQTHHSRLPRYDIHPISIKMIEKGNPWVTKDSYSEKFHPNERFIVALNRKRPFALLLHDPTHNTIKARLWSRNGNFEKQIKNFKNDLTQRIHTAFKTRKDLKILEKRNNFYLLFGEADQVPGLFIQFIGGEVLVQFYANFWERYQDFIIQTVIKKMNDVFKMEIFKMQMWIQKRVEGLGIKEPPYCLDPNTTYKNVTVNEFGANYKVNLGQHYDIGLYTDMSSVRNTLKSYFENSKSVLNLYSYTGAFSLFALANGAQNVTSIDLSDKYLEWLEENLDLNAPFKEKSHRSIASNALDGLNTLNGENKKYDLIICDPPSSSSDGQKRTNALKDYEKLLPAMFKLLNKDGKIVVFLNTHKINKKKFQFKLHDVIKFHKLPLRTSKFLGLGEDCPAMPRFPEGSYLKGYVIEFDQKRLQESQSDSLQQVVHNDHENTESKTQIQTPVDSKKETKQSDKKVTEKVTEKATKKVTKKVTKKTTKKTTKKATKKVTKKATKRVTKKKPSND